MDWMTALFLMGAGAVGGVINAVAGGATLITFPAMLQVGLPPVIANASNAMAIMPGHLIAALA
ncbi:MAG: sulfite exporter TauE/SafE family protein, partial [Oxalobacteraceae bacterium]